MSDDRNIFQKMDHIEKLLANAVNRPEAEQYELEEAYEVCDELQEDLEAILDRQS